MLLNKVTGVISAEGVMKVDNYVESLKVYVEVYVEEVEGGFKLVGETENGEKIEAF